MTDNPTVTPEAPSKPWINPDLQMAKIFPWNLENFLAIVLLVLAVCTRLYGLGDRGISHDEVNHLVPSYALAQGQGFRFDPMTHGPLQMHLIALSFILFSDNDFTARLPAAAVQHHHRGHRAIPLPPVFGTHRGDRRRAAVPDLALHAVLRKVPAQRGVHRRLVAASIYSVLRYLELGEVKMLVLFTIVNALHFTDKATSFIYAGGMMAFLAGYFLYRLVRRKDIFRLTLLRSLACLAVAAVFLIAAAFMIRNADALTMVPGLVVGLIGLAAGIAGVFLLFQDLGGVIRQERSFDLMVLLGTFFLPLTSAAFMDFLGKLFGGRAPQDMNFSNVVSLVDLVSTKDIYTALAYILPLAVISILVGLWWNRKLWLVLALIFFGIFAFFFTTVFSYSGGIFDGLVRYLGYWIQQNGDARGAQPWFYYLFLQIPIYEYLPAIGSVIALFIAARRKLWASDSGAPFAPFSGTEETQIAVPTVALMLFWGLFNLAIFSYAGEKMPQQTMLIAAPMILAAAWAIGYFLENGMLAFGAHAAQHRCWACWRCCAVLTARTAYTATYINYDYPFEYMAYAHGGTGPKIVLKEIQRISLLTTGTTNLVVAYDNEVRYPFWWSLRHYPNRIDFDVNPTEDIRRAAIVVVGDQNNSQGGADPRAGLRRLPTWCGCGGTTRIISTSNGI